MRFGKLDLNLLVALDHLLTLRSITQSADRMNLSQSAMSSALRRLRDYFDDPLLVQVGRQMELTPRGEALRQPIRELLVQVESAIGQVMSFDPATSDREFSIIESDYLLHVLTPPMLAIAAREAPQVKFKLLSHVTRPHEIIQRGEADLLIAPDYLMSELHPSEPLYSDCFSVVAWSEGRYGRGEMTLECYLEAGHVLMISPADTRPLEADPIAALGIERRVEVECYSFTALPALLAQTDRIATLHNQLIPAATRAWPLTVHPLPFKSPRIDEHAQWHRHMEQDPGLIWLRDVLQRAARQLAENEPLG